MTQPERFFGRALWLKENLPITADEWALLCLLIFGDLPEKWPTPEQVAAARERFTPLRHLAVLPADEEARPIETSGAARRAVGSSSRD